MSWWKRWARGRGPADHAGLGARLPNSAIHASGKSAPRDRHRYAAPVCAPSPTELTNPFSDVMTNLLRLRSNDATVIVTGAGFSKSLGLPLQNELLENVVPADFIELSKYLSGVGPNREMGVEDFLTFLEFDDLVHPGGERIDYLVGFGAFLFHSMVEIKHLPRRTARRFWTMLSTLIENCDTFVTFNWDTLIEIQVRALGETVVYSGRRKRGKRVLKLHGSLDWYRTDRRIGEAKSNGLFKPIFAGCVRYGPFTEEDYFLAIPTDVRDIFNTLPPYIVTPTHLKVRPSGVFRRIWSDAHGLLEEADHIVIIGYSLPPADTLARFLFRKAMGFEQFLSSPRRPRVTIIDPDETRIVESRYAELLGPPIEFLRCRFLDVEVVIDASTYSTDKSTWMRSADA